MNKLICWLTGHIWNQTHGFKNTPEQGTNCNRCGRKYTDISQPEGQP